MLLLKNYRMSWTGTNALLLNGSIQMVSEIDVFPFGFIFEFDRNIDTDILDITKFLKYSYMDKYMEFWYNKDNKEIEKNKYLIMLDLSKEDLVTLSKKDKVVVNYME